MSLFDLSQTEPPDYSAKTPSRSVEQFCESERHHQSAGIIKIQQLIGYVHPGDVVNFWSSGEWSLWELIDHLLEQTGDGTEVYLATWSISEFSARKLASWINSGRISKLIGVIDYRSKNRHPAAFHLAKNTFSHIRVAYCHAKVTVLIGNGQYILINGSANWTENPRMESGVILHSEHMAMDSAQLICDVVNNSKYTLEL